MKILLDECIPWPIHKLLAEHECTTPQRCGWGGVRNGLLLREAEGRFDIFITADQSLRYQQNLQNRGIAILQLSTNRLREIVAAAEVLRAAVEAIRTGEFTILQIPSGGNE